MSERDLRKVKNRQKMAGGFRKDSGHEMYCAILTIIETLKRRNMGLVENAKKLFNLPIIGLTKPNIIPKNYKELVYITPNIKDVIELVEAGADVIATDATQRKRPNNEKLQDLIKYIHINKRLAMADISTLEEGLNAKELGADIISTTLAGYTLESANSPANEPDFELLKQLVEQTQLPVVLEGRIWEPEQVNKAFELGAHCVVIGSAITRPQLITKRFVFRKK